MEIAAALDDARKEEIVREAGAARRRIAQECAASSPRSWFPAVPREVKRWGSQHRTTASGVPIQLDEQPTNGVTYVTALMT